MYDLLKKLISRHEVVLNRVWFVSLCYVSFFLNNFTLVSFNVEIGFSITSIAIVTLVDFKFSKSNRLEKWRVYSTNVNVQWLSLIQDQNQKLGDVELVNRINNASLASTVFIDLAFLDVLLYSVWLYKLYLDRISSLGRCPFLH